MGGKKVSVLQATESLEQPDPVLDLARLVAAALSSGGGAKKRKIQWGKTTFQAVNLDFGGAGKEG